MSCPRQHDIATILVVSTPSLFLPIHTLAQHEISEPTKFPPGLLYSVVNIAYDITANFSSHELTK